RFGAQWWRSTGTASDPGTMLVTLHGVARPGVYEVALGSPMRHVLRNAGVHDVSGVLVGGYFGTWLTPRQAAMVTLSGDDLKAMGAGLGCGAIAVLTGDTCPVAELARVTRWLASQSAGQIGACAHWLPAIQGELEHTANRSNRGNSAEVEDMHLLVMDEGISGCS